MIIGTGQARNGMAQCHITREIAAPLPFAGGAISDAAIAIRSLGAMEDVPVLTASVTTMNYFSPHSAFLPKRYGPGVQRKALRRAFLCKA